MSQHFLLSTAARTLSLARVARMSDEEAAEAFKQIRWYATGGEPVCPRCGCLGVYAYKSRALFKCKACDHQFSVTSGTIFASRKLPLRTILLAIAIFVNGAKGHSALATEPRSRRAIQDRLRSLAQTPRSPGGRESRRYGVRRRSQSTAPISAATFARRTMENRVDRRLAINQTGKRRVVVIAREKQRQDASLRVQGRAEALETLGERIEVGSTVHADEATHWDALHSRYLTKRINHQEAYSDGRRLHESRRVVFLSPAPLRNRHSSSYRRAVP